MENFSCIDVKLDLFVQEGTFSSRVNIKTITDRLRGVSVGGESEFLALKYDASFTFNHQAH